VSKVVISLTTIPPRMDRIGPTLESLTKQTAVIDAILLWVPQAYRRQKFGAFSIPPVPAPVEIRRCETDYGPATKLLPTLREYNGQDVRIIYCDDDRIYAPDWAANLLNESEAHAGMCIAEAGEMAASILVKYRATAAFSRFLRYSSLGVWAHFHRRELREIDPGIGIVDICKGYGGVLVRPEFFPSDVFDIPDPLWTVDDIWLSGNLAVSGIAIWKICRFPWFERSTKTGVADIEPLIAYVYGNQRREGANAACIRYFQERYGVWLSPQPCRATGS
jgi:hypothetical protein